MIYLLSSSTARAFSFILNSIILLIISANQLPSTLAQKNPRMSQGKQADFLFSPCIVGCVVAVPKILVESDCESLVLSLVSTDQRTEKCMWELRALMLEAHVLLASFSNLRLAFCNRPTNRVADWVVKARRKKVLPVNWLAHPPPALLELLCFDCPSIVGNISIYK